MYLYNKAIKKRGINMKYTSAEAGKLLKKLNDERASLLLREENSKDFLAAVGEDLESVRPDYNFATTQVALFFMLIF